MGKFNPVVSQPNLDITNSSVHEAEAWKHVATLSRRELNTAAEQNRVLGDMIRERDQQITKLLRHVTQLECCLRDLRAIRDASDAIASYVSSPSPHKPLWDALRGGREAGSSRWTPT